jgi:decaprenyl-phosphate phosphoribosyltransferase
VFCLFSSAVYIFNDRRDIEADRQHASGRVPVAVPALLVAAAAMIRSRSPTLPSSSPSISRSTFGYSLGIKHVSVIELFFVASGFLIRLIDDAYAVQIYMSPWIMGAAEGDRQASRRYCTCKRLGA